MQESIVKIVATNTVHLQTVYDENKLKIEIYFALPNVNVNR